MDVRLAITKPKMVYKPLTSLKKSNISLQKQKQKISVVTSLYPIQVILAACCSFYKVDEVFVETVGSSFWISFRCPWEMRK